PTSTVSRRATSCTELSRPAALHPGFGANCSDTRCTRRICMPNIAAMWVDRRPPAAQFARAVVISSHFSQEADRFVPDSRQAWVRLAFALSLASVGAVGMWSVVVVMPVVQTEFAASRGAVSLAATMIFFGFGLGGVIMGRITDRLGIVPAMA